MSIATKPIQPLGWKELYAAHYTFNSNFHLELDNGEILYIEKVVRLIPKRRMVVFASWQGKSIVAKLFFHPQQAKRQMEKDLAGVLSLQSKNIPSPALLGQCTSKDRRIYILIFEKIEKSKSLNELWETKSDAKYIVPTLKNVMVELATQHVLGILQRDLHLKNFLVTKKFIYTLDGAQIKSSDTILQKAVCVPNVALFLAQLGIGMDVYQEQLFRHYADARGWLLKPKDFLELCKQIKKCNRTRWENFSKKIFRNSTEFCSIHTWNIQCMYVREYESSALLKLLHNPELAFNTPAAEILKAGRSATVIKIKLDNRDYVIKRYNLKNTLHRLRRTLRRTRATNSWTLAHKLRLFGISTARPVAFVENNFLKFRGISYAITKFVGSQNAGDYFATHSDSENAMLMRKIAKLFVQLAKLNMTHGDLKITNILIDEFDQPVLIDLDGMQEHTTRQSFIKNWQSDMQRFLENFNSMPELQTQFISILTEYSAHFTQ